MGGAAAAAAAAKVPLRVGAGPAAGHEGKRGHGNEGEGVLSRCTGEDAVWGQGRMLDPAPAALPAAPCAGIHASQIAHAADMKGQRLTIRLVRQSAV
eukprot:1161133-Pelagomonas_calceolata.AAC.3